jgi:hypothetical protein
MTGKLLQKIWEEVTGDKDKSVSVVPYCFLSVKYCCGDHFKENETAQNT